MISVAISVILFVALLQAVLEVIILRDHIKQVEALNTQLSKDALSDIDKILKLDKRLREAKELLEVQDKLIK